MKGQKCFISTEGAFGRPMTYDDHPIHPSIQKSLNELKTDFNVTKIF